MATKNKLKYFITADHTGFEKGMKSVERAATNGAKAAGVGLAGITAGAAAVTASVIAVADAMQGAGDKAREIENLSKLANSSVESFQNYAFAAQQAGVSNEKLADISKDLQDKLGDFIATGGGGFKDFFENVAPAVDLTAESLQGLSGPDALIAVKKAMDDANVSAEQQVFYLESIASDAALLTPLLQDNGAAFKEQAARADDLSIALSGIQVDNLMDAQQSVKETQLILESLKDKTLAALAPAFTTVTDTIISQMAGVEDGIDGVAIVFGGKILDGIDAVVTGLEYVHLGWLAIKTAVPVVVDTWGKGVSLMYDGLRNSLLAPLDLTFQGMEKVADFAGTDFVNPFDAAREKFDEFGNVTHGVMEKNFEDIKNAKEGYESVHVAIALMKEKMVDVDEQRRKSAKKEREENKKRKRDHSKTEEALTAKEKVELERRLKEEERHAREKERITGDLTDELNRLTMTEFQYKVTALDDYVYKLEQSAGDDKRLQDQIVRYHEAATDKIVNDAIKADDKKKESADSWRSFSEDAFDRLSGAFKRNEDLKTTVAGLATDTLIGYGKQWAIEGLSEIMGRHGAEIGANVALGTAQTGTEGKTWQQKLGTGAAYLAAAAAAVYAGKAVGDNFAADGAWIANHANGGLATGGSGMRDDIFAGYSVDGNGNPLRNWIMGGEYVINKKQTAKFYPLIKAINDDELADGGPVGDAMQTTRDINASIFDTFWSEVVRTKGNWYAAAAQAAVYGVGTLAGALAGKEIGGEVFKADGGPIGDKKFFLGGLTDWFKDPIGDVVNDLFGDTLGGILYPDISEIGFGALYEQLRKLPEYKWIADSLDAALYPWVRDVITPGKFPDMRTAEDSISGLTDQLAESVKEYATGFNVLDWFETGTDYVPKTGPYMLHKGESVNSASDQREIIRLLRELIVAVRESMTIDGAPIRAIAQQTYDSERVRQANRPVGDLQYRYA